MRRFYVNREARVGEVFGVFADHNEAVRVLRQCNRDLNTHTIYRTLCGSVVNVRGY